MSILSLKEISKRYKDETRRSERVLSHFNLEVERGEIVWLRGSSGSGKSTVLNIAGLLSTPDGGSRKIDGVDVTTPSQSLAAQTRRTKIGMVFQHSNLLPELTAVENIMVASVSVLTESEVIDRLAEFDLTSIARHKAKQLSGGQQQRVAFCRALVNEPLLLLADEPNSGLDDNNTNNVREALVAAAARGCAVLLASHSDAFEQIVSRTLDMERGRIG
ncbi:ABC transporter ATP-binding protein [Psychromicrobium sp. YIM B11713]|uniref:ABC transporter ATP-binding protein n=1 Tax=Psychromicrobium sp. YIM B11713 TaxID=3145233 RepID=UPI00374F6251